MESIGQRIRRLRGKETQAELAKRVGVSRVAISNWERGETKNLKGKNLINLARCLKTDTDYILSGSSSSVASKSSRRKAPSDHNVTAGPPTIGMVPSISWVQAGAWSEVVDPYAVGDAQEWLPCPVPHSEHTFALKVRGLSMYNPGGKKSYSEGDTIYVDPALQPENGSMVVVRLDDEQEATFKQLVIEGERRYLVALNPSWPDRIMEINGRATIVGVVIGKWVPE